MKTVKIKGLELNKEQLLELVSILEVQETTDKEEIGSQIELEADSGTFNYKVDKEYNIVLKSVK